MPPTCCFPNTSLAFPHDLNIAQCLFSGGKLDSNLLLQKNMQAEAQNFEAVLRIGYIIHPICLLFNTVLFFL